MAPSVRWDLDALNAIRGTPWQWKPDEGEIDVEMPKAPHIEVETPTEGQAEPSGRAAKRCDIHRADVVNYGGTRRNGKMCPGCAAALDGRQTNHTEWCRKRFIDEFEKTPEGREKLRRSELR